MAETVIGIFKDKLFPLLKTEWSLLTGFSAKGAKISQQLEEIHSHLKKADNIGTGDITTDDVKSWVRDLRDVSFQNEDLVTEYTHHMEEQPPDCHEGGFQECLGEIPSFFIFWCSRIQQRHDLAKKIVEIEEEYNKIRQRGNGNVDIRSILDGTMQNALSSNAHRSSLCLVKTELVGFESARDELVRLLDKFFIIPVVGMAGSGKSTLAQQVYDHVRGSFKCHAWVEVHKPYRIQEILRTLFKNLCKSTNASVPDEIQTMDEETLVCKLSPLLKENKCFVIFEDVWKEDFWGEIGNAFIDGHVGGRIMITTRHRQVGRYCLRRQRSVHEYNMKPLSTEKARDLFYNKTFGPHGCCPKELEDISGQIIEKFKGVPLALVIIAGILSTKDEDISVWRRFQKSFSSELEKDVDLQQVQQIISLSYDELPYHLKPCLLYFGMFPSSHYVRNGRLIRQWIAEGFVKAEEGKTLEEVAQEYMNELIDRSLVIPESLDVTRKPKKCRVHEILHEIILKKTKEVSFCRVIPGSDDRSKARRVAIRGANDILHALSVISTPHVHSFIAFFESDTLNSIVPMFLINFEFLKVLDFEDAPHLDHLPEDIGKLFDLRYLSVRWTNVKILPRSMEKLKKLETLDLRELSVCEIPAGMLKRLHKLRNLYAAPKEGSRKECFPDGIKAIAVLDEKTECGIGFPRELQKLFFVRADHLFEYLGDLTQLRSLGIVGLRNEDGWRLCGCTEKMERLQSLTVESTRKDEVVDLESMSRDALQDLRRLNLSGRLKKLPEWFSSLRCLVKLRLNYSKLEDDPLDVLQKIPSLKDLSIRYDAYVGEQLRFKKGVLQNLERLYLVDLSKLSLLIIEEDALPKLEALEIAKCPQMETVPNGLGHLKKLKTLIFHEVTASFIWYQDFQSVSHVPQVKFSYVDDDGKTEWFTLGQVREEQQEGASTSGCTEDEHTTSEGACTTGASN